MGHGSRRQLCVAILHGNSRWQFFTAILLSHPTLGTYTALLHWAPTQPSYAGHSLHVLCVPFQLVCVMEQSRPHFCEIWSTTARLVIEKHRLEHKKVCMDRLRRYERGC